MTTRLSCLLIQVRDDTPEQAQRNIAQIILICTAAGGVIFDMMASIQLVAFGKLLEEIEQSTEHITTFPMKFLPK